MRIMLAPCIISSHMTLIIVESPTKARTFNFILKGPAPKGKEAKVAAAKAAAKAKKAGDKDYYVFATLGHIRDLPGDRMAVDFSRHFEPDYVIMEKKKKVIDQLKQLQKEHDEIIFATDPDREGEAISYHAAYVLGLIDEKWPEITIKKPLKRIVFHEITKNALEEALQNPQELRLDLVKAQQARRILDRVVGYELSPLLWKKLNKNWLSAGRVQTVALRLVTEREKEIRKFPQEDYYNIYGYFLCEGEQRAKLVRFNGEPYERQFTIDLFVGQYKYTKTTIDESASKSIISDLQEDTYKVGERKENVASKYPPPPYTTSQLQQDGINRFGMSSKMIMRIAQSLYEKGYITYHRTDSFNLSSSFVFRAKDHIIATYGKEYALEKPRGYRTRSASAQEAHEAIRPTKLDRTPKEVEKDEKLTKPHKQIYEMIYNRALATQMKEAQVKEITITIKSGKGYEFETVFQQVLFDGFLKLTNPEFVKKHRDDTPVTQSSAVAFTKAESEAKKTQPPYRYTEASLIKTLEEHGIGRPSTYAPIISLIQEKRYVDKQGKVLKPTSLGEVISDYLSTSFSNLFDIDFTAKMEQELDDIADGKITTLQLLEEFYDPFKKELEERKKDTTVLEVKEETDEKCPKCGRNLSIRFSRFGKFFACSGYPECKFTKPFLKIAEGKKCPKCGSDIAIRYSKSRKKFYGCSTFPDCDFTAFAWNQLPNKDGSPVAKDEEEK